MAMMTTAAQDDSDLVVATLSGNRDAFGQIVSRYQNLICSLAYSAVGNVSQSEDLAQETFLTAWKQLRDLREPEKLRAWLCGIARNLINNFLRKSGREPSHRAESLEEISESHSPEPLPLEKTISNEEAQILWRSLEKIPEIYREPLVLFYRQHQSIETVAANLDLSEDAVKQRLSRGRKLLQEQVLGFVEGALSRTNPGKAFTISVLAALPAVMATSVKAATIGAAAAKGGASLKAAGTLGWLSWIFSPLAVIFGNYIPYRIALAEAESNEERNRIKSIYRKICAWSSSLSIVLVSVLYFALRNQYDGHNIFLDLFLTFFVSFVVVYVVMTISVAIITSGKRRAYFSKMLAEKYGGVFPQPAFEFRSKIELFGLPLIHIRISDRYEMFKKPVMGWVAIGGRAIGGLFAFGGVAIAPFSIGGLTVGLMSLGGINLGILPCGAFSIGIWTFGAVAIGWQSFGAFAIAWNAAVGNFALAHTFATGQVARAIHANNDVAKQFVDASLFFRWMRVMNGHWFWMNFLWVVPMFIQWQIVARRRLAKKTLNLEIF